MDHLVAARHHRSTIDAKMAAAHQPTESGPPASQPPAQQGPVHEPQKQKTAWQLVQSAYAPTRAGVAAAAARKTTPGRPTPSRGLPGHEDHER